MKWLRRIAGSAKLARRLGTYHPYTTIADPRLNVAQTTFQT